MIDIKQALRGVSEAWPKVKDRVLEWTIAAITVPYYLLYDRNTKSRLVAIAEAEQNGETLKILQKWLTTKDKEAQYVQVAGAVTFASAISTLSWTDLSGRHWTGPACWYTSIILSMTAVLSGAQQTMLLGSLQQVSATIIREHLCQSSGKPSWKHIFAWQSPLMFLSYALVFYMAGLTSYIASPVASDPKWDDNAKTLLFYVVTASSALVIFVMSSRLVHQTIPETSGRDLLYSSVGERENIHLTSLGIR